MRYSFLIFYITLLFHSSLLFTCYTNVESNQFRLASSSNRISTTAGDVFQNTESAIVEPTNYMIKTEQVDVPIVSLNNFNNECLLQQELKTEQGLSIPFLNDMFT